MQHVRFSTVTAVQDIPQGKRTNLVPLHLSLQGTPTDQVQAPCKAMKSVSGWVTGLMAPAITFDRCFNVVTASLRITDRELQGKPCSEFIMRAAGAASARDLKGLHDRRRYGSCTASRPSMCPFMTETSACGRKEWLTVVLLMASFHEQQPRRSAQGLYQIARKQQSSRIVNASGNSSIDDLLTPNSKAQKLVRRGTQSRLDDTLHLFSKTFSISVFSLRVVRTLK
jgi:hypothetical protein